MSGDGLWVVDGERRGFLSGMQSVKIQMNIMRKMISANFLFSNSRYPRVCVCVRVCLCVYVHVYVYVRSFNCNPLRSFGFQCFISMQYYNVTQKNKSNFWLLYSICPLGAQPEPCVGFWGGQISVSVHVSVCVCGWARQAMSSATHGILRTMAAVVMHTLYSKAHKVNRTQVDEIHTNKFSHFIVFSM